MSIYSRYDKHKNPTIVRVINILLGMYILALNTKERDVDAL